MTLPFKYLNLEKQSNHLSILLQNKFQKAALSK